jgi:hypothetical protein
MTSPIDATAVKELRALRESSPPKKPPLVAQLLESQTLARGETLFHQGDASDTIYLIISGEMEILLRVPDHDDHHLVYLRTRDDFRRSGAPGGRTPHGDRHGAHGSESRQAPLERAGKSAWKIASGGR